MKYFKLSEFETAGMVVSDKTIQFNIENLVDKVLDRVRAFYGHAIYVVDGYSLKSVHQGHSTGCAADITTKSIEGNQLIFKYIKNNLEFDEVIVNGNYDSIHVSSYPSNRGVATDKQEVVIPPVIIEQVKTDYTVCIESGHGKDVAGKRSPDSSLLEWQWTREMKYRLIELFKAAGIKYYDVNPEDTEPGLATRVNRANQIHSKNNKKSIFVSIHVNAAGRGEWMNARGWSIFTSRGQTQGDVLAETIWVEANKVFTPKGLKIRTDLSDGDHDLESNFYVIKNTSAPAVLIENFFMDNKEDCKYLLSEEGKQDCLTVMYNGICNYLKSVK